MRSAIAGPVTPLLGSLGLHGGVALALLVAVHHLTPLPRPERVRPDAWAGNAVEVDAVATPEVAAPNGAPAPDHADPTDATEATAAGGVPGPAPKAEQPAPDRAAPKAPQVPPSPGTPRVPKSAPRRETTGAPAPDASAAQSSATTGTFGSQGLPPGVRSLPSAFTRAIPAATGADPIWQTLPVGSERPFTVAIEVGADGHISSAEILKEKDGSAPEAQASHLRERVLALLGGGLFALQNDVGAGRELFRVTITLSERAVHDDDDPAQLVERGFDPPRTGAPGRAYFTLASGRHFEARVQVLPRP
jgi:hypothetical protein